MRITTIMASLALLVCSGCIETEKPPSDERQADDKEAAGSGTEAAAPADRGEPRGGALGPADLANLNSPLAAQAHQLRTLGLAMMIQADQDRRGQMLPEAAESWRVALGRATNAYEPNRLRDQNGKTRLLLVTGPGTCFNPEDPHRGTRRIIETAPRSAETIPLVIMVGPDQAVDVEEPRDFVFDPGNPKSGLGNIDDPFLVLMADGSVRKFPKSISPAAFTVLCQIEPQVDEQTFAEIVPELKRLGLPSVLPRRRPKAPLE